MKKLDKKGSVEVTATCDPQFTPLDQFMATNKNMDVTMKNQIIAHIWIAFQAVTQTTTHSSKNVRLISLHPSNILIKVTTRGKRRSIEIKFTKYLPQIFYESIVMKDESLRRGYPQNVSDDWLYISPKILNLNQNANYHGKRGVFRGTESISLEDMYYSLGCLFATLDANADVMKSFGMQTILDRYYNNAFCDPSDLMFNEGIKQFVKMMMNLKTSIKEITEATYVLTMNSNLVPNEINPEDLEFIEKLGSGAFATLFKCKYRDESGRESIVAVKQFDLKQQGIRLEQIYVEYEMMALCNCPNSVSVKGIVNCSKSIDPEYKKNGQFVYILMECCDLGALDSYISKKWNHGQIPKEFVEHVFIEMLWGLWYLHSQRCIVHRDIKPENILLMTNKINENMPHIKLSDLGVSKMIMDDNEAPKTFAGTKQFMAPEIQIPGAGETYTYKIDLWSCAVTIYQLVTYNWAMGFRDAKATINCQYKIDVLFTESVWENYPELKEVLTHLFVYDYEDRWGWPELFRCKYIQTLLLKRKKRMLSEMNNGKAVSNDEAIRRMAEENDYIMQSFHKLYKIAYKK